MLRVTQIAERLNCSPSTVYSLIESGELGHYRCPGIRVSEEQLDAYLRERERGPRPAARAPIPRVRLKHITI